MLELHLLVSKYRDGTHTTAERERILTLLAHRDGVLYQSVSGNIVSCKIRWDSQCSGSVYVWSAHIDHILPKERGGTTTPDNLQTACEHCNCAKGDSVRRPRFY